jgi:hypothetical protein
VVKKSCRSPVAIAFSCTYYQTMTWTSSKSVVVICSLSFCSCLLLQQCSEFLHVLVSISIHRVAFQFSICPCRVQALPTNQLMYCDKIAILQTCRQTCRLCHACVRPMDFHLHIATVQPYPCTVVEKPIMRPHIFASCMQLGRRVYSDPVGHSTYHLQHGIDV